MSTDFEDYKKTFRDLHVEAEETLLGIHVLIYVIANGLWIMLNLLFVPSRYRWIMFYPLIGWGSLIFVHWWFYVRNADRLCRLKEERTGIKVAAKNIKPE
jgi:hypothetical protein